MKIIHCVYILLFKILIKQVFHSEHLLKQLWIRSFGSSFQWQLSITTFKISFCFYSFDVTFHAEMNTISNLNHYMSILKLLLIFNRGFTCIIWFGHQKEIIQPNFAFPPLCCNFYRLLIATSTDHWVPIMLFAFQLIN